jgi:hypothetical protein
MEEGILSVTRLDETKTVSLITLSIVPLLAAITSSPQPSG